MSYWARFVTRVAVRRVVAVLVLLVLAVCVLLPTALAAPGHPSDPDPATAWQHCQAHLAYLDANNAGYAPFYCALVSGSYASGTGEVRHLTRQGSNFSYGTAPDYHRFIAGCPTGTEWNESTKTCFDPAQCLAKAPLGASSVPGGFGACVDGCAFSSGQPLTIQFGEGSTAKTLTSGWKPTGEACAAGDKPPVPMVNDQSCEQLPNGQTACVRADKKICYSASAGAATQFCWSPGETGEKTHDDKMQKVNAGDQPIPPNVNLESGDRLQQNGQPTTTTTTNGTTTTTTTTTNYNTQFGTNAGGKNQGQPGDGSGTGEGDGDKDGEGGAPGQGVGKLYEAKGKTVGDVMSAFESKVMQSPLLGVASNFMGNCSFSGQCPVWTYEAEYMGKVTFDALCSGALSSLLGYAGYIVLALAGFAAFRIGVY